MMRDLEKDKQWMLNRCGKAKNDEDASNRIDEFAIEASRGWPAAIERAIAAEAEVERLKNWINDLQSGMYVNCVYCGHRYGPSEDTPVSMADVLKQHIEQCPEHPMSKMKSTLIEAKDVITELILKLSYAEHVLEKDDEVRIYPMPVLDKINALIK